MRILALDSSGLVASVAVVEKDGEETSTIAEYTDRDHLPDSELDLRRRRVWDLH